MEEGEHDDITSNIVYGLDDSDDDGERKVIEVE